MARISNREKKSTPGLLDFFFARSIASATEDSGAARVGDVWLGPIVVAVPRECRINVVRGQDYNCYWRISALQRGDELVRLVDEDTGTPVILHNRRLALTVEKSFGALSIVHPKELTLARVGGISIQPG